MRKITLLSLSLIICLSACVSKKKFHKEQGKVKDLQSDSLGTHNKLKDCYANVAELQSEKEAVQKNLQNLSSSSKASIANSQMTIAEQAKRLNDLQLLIQGQKDLMNKFATHWY